MTGRVNDPTMETEDRGPDLLWADRLVAVLAGLTTILPFASLSGLMLAAIASRIVARITTGDRAIQGGSMEWGITAILLLAGAILAALALSGCRGLWRGRRAGFVAAGMLSLLSLPLIFLFTSGGSGIPAVSPRPFLLLALGIPAYARLRLTTIGPTPI